MRFNEFHDEQTDEMIGVKKYHHLTAAQIMKKMEDELGLKKLGSGAFGDVIQSPDPNWVYKVIEKDPAYEEYLDHINDNPNKHYPKIKRVKKMTSFFKRYHIQTSQFLIIVIEKLYPIPEEKMNFVIDLVNAASLDEVAEVTPDNVDNWKGSTFEEIIQQDWKGWKPNEMAELWEAAHETRELLADWDYFSDLHRGNVMQRADGTVVLIDPVASGEGIEYGKAISAARRKQQAMVKGPRYRPELARSEPGDNPYDDVDPHPTDNPGTTTWNKQQDPALWSTNDSKAKKAFDEWKALFFKSYRNSEEEERFQKLNAYLDQKRKMQNGKENEI